MILSQHCMSGLLINIYILLTSWLVAIQLIDWQENWSIKLSGRCAVFE